MQEDWGRSIIRYGRLARRPTKMLWNSGNFFWTLKVYYIGMYAKKKLTLFLCVSLFFKQCIVVRYDPHTRLAKILLLFVIKMTKLNCTKRFLPWEFYFLDRHDVSSNIAFLVLWCIRSVYYRIWKKIGYPKLEFWVLGIS